MIDIVDKCKKYDFTTTHYECSPEEFRNKLITSIEKVCEELEKLTKDYSLKPVKPRSISDIRKDMKHCKNHMRRVELERELQSAYKERKKKKCYGT